MRIQILGKYPTIADIFPFYGGECFPVMCIFLTPITLYFNAYSPAFPLEPCALLGGTLVPVSWAFHVGVLSLTPMRVVWILGNLNGLHKWSCHRLAKRKGGTSKMWINDTVKIRK